MKRTAGILMTVTFLSSAPALAAQGEVEVGSTVSTGDELHVEITGEAARSMYRLLKYGSADRRGRTMPLKDRVEGENVACELTQESACPVCPAFVPTYRCSYLLDGDGAARPAEARPGPVPPGVEHLGQGFSCNLLPRGEENNGGVKVYLVDMNGGWRTAGSARLIADSASFRPTRVLADDRESSFGYFGRNLKATSESQGAELEIQIRPATPSEIYRGSLTLKDFDVPLVGTCTRMEDVVRHRKQF